MANNEGNQEAKTAFIADGDFNPTPNEGPRRQTCPSCKTVLCAIMIVLFIIIVVLAVLYGQSRCPACCPFDWIGYKGKCYYFSKDEGNWTSSQGFCISHGASLVNIETEKEDIITRMKGKDIYWIGLSRDPGQPWKWTNGEISMLKVMGENGGDCAYLNDEFKPSSSRCFQEHRWICTVVMQ